MLKTTVSLTPPSAACCQPVILTHAQRRCRPYVPRSAVDAGVSSTALLKLGGNDSYILAASQLPAAGSIAIGAQPGSMRGCLLGASKLLTMLGFDFIAADETVVPDGPLTSSIRSDTFLEYTPAFEYRDNNEYSAQHNAGWAGALGYNGPSAHGDEGGGFVEYVRNARAQLLPTQMSPSG